MNAALKQQMHMHRHLRRRHLLKRHRIRSRREHAAPAQPPRARLAGTRPMHLRNESRRIVPIPAPSRAQQHHIARSRFQMRAAQSRFHMRGHDFEIRRQSIHAGFRGNIEQQPTPENRRNRIHRMPFDPAGIALQRSHIKSAMQFAAAGKMAQRVDMRAHMSAQSQRFRSRTRARRRDIFAMLLNQSEQIRRMIRMVRHARIIGLRQVVNAGGAKRVEQRHSKILAHRDTIVPSVKITISKENYLKAIAEAESEGESVKASTLSRWVNVSAPAVTMAIKRLKRDALIHVGEEGQITLTSNGREIADRILNRHHLIERMLTEIFGMEWYKVHDEAEQLEHAVSGDFERKLAEKLGTGGVCPHGNSVGVDTPADRRHRGLTTLDESQASATVSVASVYERDRKLLEYLDGLGVRPGVTLRVDARNYDDTLTLRVDGRSVQLGRSAAQKIWVTAAG